MRKTPLLGASLLALLALAGCRTVGIAFTPGGYAEVSPQIANEMIVDTNQVVVIDVRPYAAFSGRDGHIPGALSAPFDTIERQLPELLPYQGDTVLIYGESSTDGTLAARVLTVAGFRNVVHIDGGFQAWIERGYTTVSGR